MMAHSPTHLHPCRLLEAAPARQLCVESATHPLVFQIWQPNLEKQYGVSKSLFGVEMMLSVLGLMAGSVFCVSAEKRMGTKAALLSGFALFLLCIDPAPACGKQFYCLQPLFFPLAQ